MLKTTPELLRELEHRVRVVDAVTALEESRARNGIIIDVRETDEVNVKTARGTLHVSRGMLEFKLPQLCPQHDRPIYVHCASGGRARLAVDQLQRLGYTEVAAISCSFEEICRIFEQRPAHGHEA